MRISELDGAVVGVWGAGREGRSAIAALRGAARIVVYSDHALPAAEAAELKPLDVEIAGDFAGLLACDVVIRSPGVSVYRPEIEQLRAAGVPVTTGTNLWFADHPDARTVAVTGTKGKSTTSALIAHLLRSLDLEVVLAGNGGTPLLEFLHVEREPDVWALELSSYQTADIDWSPNVGVVLNLYREHTDWHGTQERYFEDKLNMLAHRPDRIAVLNAADPALVARADRLEPAAWFGADDGYHVRDGGIWRGERRLFDAGGLRLIGRHNLVNACAALTAIEALGAPAEHIPPAALASFAPLPHRLADAGSLLGRRLVDDSIATTPESTIAALDALAGRPLALLVGGHDRDQRYGALARRVAADADVTAVVALPANGRRILDEVARAAGDRGPALHSARDMRTAVERALAATPEGGVILLSPAAPSFGQFESFEHRGRAFVAAAAELERAAGGVEGSAGAAATASLGADPPRS